MSQYESYFQWKDWPLDFAFTDFDRRYYERELGGIAAPGQRIIELGFGNGGFLVWAKQRGAEVYGVEIQPEIIAAAERHGLIAVHQPGDLLPYRQSGFDAVVALDVFEHIPTDEIPRTLAMVDQLLKPSGTLTIRVPNGLSPFGRYNQYQDATHMNVITPAKMSQWAFATHLRVVDVRNQARVPVRNTLSHRLLKSFQFAIREVTSRTIARIYGLPVRALDPNLMIVLRKVD